MTPQKSRLERALSVIAEVRPGEGRAVLLLALNIFILLLAYYLLKPVRDAFILTVPSGAEYRSYLSGTVALPLLMAVPAYAAIAKRISPRALVVGVLLFFASHLPVFYFFAGDGGLLLAVCFYLWLGVFNMMVVAQAWSLAADLYTDQQGKRLFPIIGVGASAGGAAGGLLSTLFIDALGLNAMLLVAAACLVVVAAFSFFVHGPSPEDDERDLRSDSSASLERVSVAPPQVVERGAFRSVLQHPTLRLFALLSVVFTLAITNADYLLASFAADAADAMSDPKRHIAAFYSRYHVAVNTLGLVFQLFVVSRVMKRGVILALSILPFVSIFGATSMLFVPTLATAHFFKVAENSLFYSLYATARQALWLPLSRAQKYQAKQAIDTFFVRLGDMASALMVFVIASLSLPPITLAGVNLLVIALWLWVVRGIAKARRQNVDRTS